MPSGCVLGEGGAHLLCEPSLRFGFAPATAFFAVSFPDGPRALNDAGADEAAGQCHPDLDAKLR